MGDGMVLIHGAAHSARLGIEEVTEVDAGHDLTVSQPQVLASVLQRHAEPLR